MLDINICIISCIVFSDLVPDIYFHNTDTWDSCDMHYLVYMKFLSWPCEFNLWSRVLMIMLHDSYSFRTSHVHYIHVTTCMHDLIIYNLSSRLFLLLLLLSVLDTVKYIVLLILMPYLHCYCIFIFSLLLFFFLRVLLLVRFWQIIIIFQYLD